MRSHARVVVIGGGVVGCSVLYHLTKHGWTDIVLVERSELTSGSSWHAAGAIHTLNGDPNVAKLQKYTVELYKEIEEISGQSCSVHMTGGMVLAGTKERMDWLKMAHARGRYLGMETELVSATEAKRLMPLLDERYFVGGLYDPFEGHVDPSGVTYAYAKAARAKGAEISLRNRVIDTVLRPDGSWDVVTEQGTIRAEHVVNCGGLWAREVGRYVGLELPILAMEHMYLLTEDMPEVAEANRATGKELLVILDFEGEIYLRQERGGMLLGTYEQACRPWSPKTTPWEFGHELLEPDLDRIAPSLEVGFRHFPAFQNAGIKKIINGPFTFAPDGNPLVGPVRGLPNYWVACAVMAGFCQGGGVGLALSNWIVESDPGHDVWGMDVARYGDWATLKYTNAKVRENYSRRFRIRFPNEELPEARPLKTTGIYDRLKEHNAVFGDYWGLEHALWFAPPGQEPRDVFSFRRTNDFESVAAECRAVREGVGLLEISNFAKYEVSGPAAEAWLDHLLPNKLPSLGRMVLTPLLNEKGMLIGDFTVARLAADSFYIFGSGMAEQYHMRWFLAHLPKDGGVSVRPLGLALQGLQIAGPKSRELLGRVAGCDVSREAFPFMAFRSADVGMIPAMIGRVTFTGDLGYEIWVQPEYLRSLFDLLLATGADLGIRPFGGRALNAMRLEKSFGTWFREYRPIYTPFEAGLDRFVSMQKPDFIGREGLVRARDAGPRRKLSTFVVDAADADVIADEPIWRDGKVVGWVTSGGYGHSVQKSIALGYVDIERLDASADYAVEILGEIRPARIAEHALFDPSGSRMRL
jgi:dimethylglycine dehydrogenase